MSNTLHRIVWPEANRVELDTAALPAPGPGEMLVRTITTLISPGTERAFFNGSAGNCIYPHYPGYSNVGEVLQVGPFKNGALKFLPGMRVASQTGHSSHVIAETAQSVEVPEALTDEEAAFCAVTCIALQGVRKAHLEMGESVVIIGCGLIGLLAMQLAKASGALPVVSSDCDSQRLAFARNLGADATFATADDLSTEIKKCLGADGADVVIEASGHPLAINTAVKLARRGGRVVLLGSTRGETTLDFYTDVHCRGLKIIGAHNGARPVQDASPGLRSLPQDQALAVKLLTAKRLQVRPLATHEFHWSEAAKAYALLTEGRSDVQAMLLRWD